MYQAIRQAGVKTCVGLECRFLSQFLAIKPVIERGLLGTLHYGEVDYYHGIGPGTASFAGRREKNRAEALPFRQAAMRWTLSCFAWVTTSQRLPVTDPSLRTRSLPLTNIPGQRYDSQVP